MSRAKIMIVEDEFIIAMHMKVLLKKMGYEVTAMLTTGEEALEQVIKGQNCLDLPDIILIDISLDGKMDGIQTALEIKKNTSIPIIFSTAYTDDEILTRAKLAEPSGYLIKPVDSRQMTITIDMALHKAKMELELKKSEERFRQMAEASPFPIYIMDKNSRLIYANKKFPEVFGYKPEELPDRETWLEKFYPDPEYREEVRKTWLKDIQKAKKNQSEQREFDIRCKDGTVRSILFRLVNMDQDSCMVICEDITYRKQSREEFLKARKLEAVGILAGGIAHDFNNLLSVIMGNINLAQMQAEPGTSFARWLDEAEKAAIRAKNLTQKFTIFSSGGKPVKKVTSLKNIIENAMALAISGSNVICKYDISPDTWKVEIDSEQMNQVINNITLNAVYAMPKGGTIHVSSENIEFSEQNSGNWLSIPDGQYVKISICDQGTGISRKNLHAIFDPYFTTKKKDSRKGMGFGLPISHSIIKKHGGYIHVDSELGKGTIVYIYLPASKAEIPSPVPRQTGPSLTNKRILVMDDEEMIRDIVSQMVEYLGYSIVSSAEGRQAVDIYKQAIESGTPFDAVILDLTIPGGLGGKETLKKLLDLDPDVRAIVSSGYSSNEVIANFKQEGFKGRITKPYQIKELENVLKEVLSAE
ncbi:Two component system response regulator/histidine kinase, PAS domain-containing [Desulfonema limicola]|uniref:histidine kinase n=1 Tax=Desulfonema limicola TaxID=45656 RepID=A0A975B9A3_9BACT|nr:hybrid sensor histidine kinase/response regulator [Desulfonema limicola]QTA81364.1 Two component system response regulator/histidine kinase, PAS domain-containing [Desulfonema limicola]